ncbi:MAG: TonB-dependent receptor [Bacteroides sp.]
MYPYILLIALCLTASSSAFGQDTIRSLRLEEVVVTATQPNAPGTSSVIGRDAIQHIQAAELSDLMQLLPGALTRNPDLNSPAFFTVRSAVYGDATNAQGTGIIVDGLRMSNNANLQQISLNERGYLFNSSALSGFDVRQLSPSSIESVEVIRGVPSARYGDATSGVVLVQSKAGVQPFTAGLRFTLTEKLASVGKGFLLGKHGGTLYWGADYALSSQDPRLPECAFHRIGLQAAYAKDFARATLRFNLRAHWIKDQNKKGPNNLDGEFEKMLNRGFSFSANGQWKINRPWLSALEYRAGFTYAQQENRSSNYFSGTQQITTYTLLSGEQEAVFLPPNYFSNLSVEGRPLTAEASLTAHLQGTLPYKFYHHLQLGIDIDTEGNQGRGILFDPLRPPSKLIGERPRSYRSLPFVYHYAAFVEEKITLHSSETRRTELQAGLRLAGLQTSSIGIAPSLDPRLNLRQVLVENHNHHLSLRIGWGMMRKTPELAFLYPDKNYTDRSCFSYDDTESGHRLAVMHTYIANSSSNFGLRLPVNQKWEAGVHFRLKEMTADVVYYYERLKQGFSTSMQAAPFSYRHYEQLTEKGQQPAFTPDGVINNGNTVPSVMRSDFATYLQPDNGITQQKQGVEYTFDLGHIRPLHSAWLISGAFLKTEEVNTALSAQHPTVEINGKAYPYVGLYETDGMMANKNTWKQFNTRLQCITQLPRMGLVASVIVQAVWMDKHQRSMKSRYNNPVYAVDDAGNRLEIDPFTDTEHRKRLNPVYYLDAGGTRHRFLPEMAADKRFADLVMDISQRKIFQEDTYKPYFLVNLRVTKKIGRYVEIAFCANNLTQAQPKRYSNSLQQYIILNPDLYYGAELSLRF